MIGFGVLSLPVFSNLIAVDFFSVLVALVVGKRTGIRLLTVSFFVGVFIRYVQTIFVVLGRDAVTNSIHHRSGGSLSCGN